MLERETGAEIGSLHITQGNHANRLPNTQSNAGSHTPVESLNAVVLVDILEGVSDRHLLGTVRILLLALHLDTNNLDGLIPGRQTTTKSGGGDLLKGAELLAILLVGHLSDALLGKTAETETRTPVGHLADGNSIHTLVNTTNTLTAINIHEGGPGARGFLAGRRHLVLGDLDRLHAGAEAHGGIRLRNTASHAASDASSEIAGAEGAGIPLRLGGDKEQDGTLGRSLNPGPWDKTLVDCLHGAK